MLDLQSSVSIDMRQLSWEFFFIYSNPGKIKTTKKISTQELIFLMMNKFLKSTVIQKLAWCEMIKLYCHQRTFSQDMN